MRLRYVAAFAAGGLDAVVRRRLEALVQPARGWTWLCADDDLAIVGEAALPVMRFAGTVIVGPVFARGSARPVAALGDADAAAIVITRGQHLIDAFWGAYVAFTRAPDGLMNIVRAPFGDLGCYHRRDGRTVLIGSDAAVLQDVSPTTLAVDLEALARHLVRGEMLGAETCLDGIADIRGGDRLALADDGTTVASPLWKPWAFATDRFDDGKAAAGLLRDTVQAAVDAVTSPYDHVLLMLSGGLDSSIVAACLAGARPQLDCMTLVTPDRAGDERTYARLAAAAAGAGLAEIILNADAIDMTRSAAARLPRPTARSFTQGSERASAALAAVRGAGAIVDGGGGDNVFCSHRSVAAAADGLVAAGFGPAFWTTARVLGDLTETGLPMVMIRTLRRAWFRAPATRAAFDTALLTPAAAAIGRVQPDHHWLGAPPGALPGKAVHIALLAVAQAVVESTYAPETIPHVSPLVTQPVVELCLRVPSWLWFAPGRDRALARQAFADVVPPAIIDRRSKGAPDAFAASLIARHHATLRPLLLDGLLARAGLIDVAAVRARLDDPAPPRTLDFIRLLRLADVEAWARCWRPGGN